jgi:hypothetical protein
MFRLKSSYSRTSKIILSILLSSLCWWLFYQRPWNPKLVLNLKNFIGHEVKFKLEKPDGTIETLNLKPAPQSFEFSFLAIKPLWIQIIDSGSEILKYQSGDKSFELQLIPSGTNFPPVDSQRFNQPILEAISLMSFLIFLIIWLILENFPREISLEWRKYFLMFFIHASLLIFLFWLTFPGLMNWDSFQYFKTANQYEFSPFSGEFYISIVMVLYQFLPEIWILSLINAIAIFLSLTLISSISIKYKLERFYVLSLLLFFLYPANSLISFSSVRDISSFWFLIATLFYLFFMILNHDSSFKSSLLLFFLVLISCLGRQESVLILIPGLLMIGLKIHRQFLKNAIFICVGVMVVQGSLKYVDPPQMDKYNYQTTLLISPLSFIIKEKYPEGLPDELDKKLGKYFKNNYLLNYQSDFDIVPFHQGGVNSSAMKEDFLQFRATSLELIFKNPWSWIKNRITISNFMLGFTGLYLVSDDYFEYSKNYPVFFNQMKQQLHANNHKRSEIAHQFVAIILKFVNKYHIIFGSYLIPLVTIFGLAVSNPTCRLYALFVFLLIFRTLITCAVSPAGYYKYLLPLWLFAPFSIILLLAERKHRLTKEASAFKTL